MGKISDALTYGLTIRESANDGSDFTNPAADYRRLFLGEDGQLHVKDPAGAVTAIGAASGSVATDAIWDAAGDLAVGTGADTAGVLTKGAAGGYLSMINAGVAWNSGTSFPASKATGDRYWRTDLGMEAYWDGTQWATTQLLMASFPNLDAAVNAGVAATANIGRLEVPWQGIYQIYLVRAQVMANVTTTNDAGKYWTFKINSAPADDGADTQLGSTMTTQSLTPSNWLTLTTTIGAIPSSLARTLKLRADKVSTPGSMIAVGSLYYRIVLT